MNRQLLLIVYALLHCCLSAFSQVQVTAYIGEDIQLYAPASSDSKRTELHHVTWSSNNSCATILTPTTNPATVRITSKGTAIVSCIADYYSSYYWSINDPIYGSDVRMTERYTITCVEKGGDGGGSDGGGSGGGGSWDSDPTIPSPQVGAGWTRFNTFYYYCAVRTIEGVVMKFTQGSEPGTCLTFAWQNGTAICIDPSTSGRVTIPETVEGYTTLYINDYSFSMCKYMTEIIIPNTVKRIGNRAFQGCSSLTTMTIPASIKEIGNDAFTGCTSLRSVTCLAQEPPSVSSYSDPFYGRQSDMFLYVPKGCKTKYEEWNVWKDFKEIIELEESYNIKTSADGYATFFSSMADYSIPDGLSASVVTQVANHKLTFSKLSGNIIPRGTAVMLTSDQKQANTYTLKMVTNGTTSYEGVNLLRGSDKATTTTGDGYHYKLSYGKANSAWSKVFGWYWGTTSGASFQIEANKAWLVAPKSEANTRSFALDKGMRTQ